MTEPESGDYELNLGAWQTASAVNGPGRRFVLWLQGCPLGCPGCINPEYVPFERRAVVTVDRLAGLIQAVGGIEGVTYTGGEPTAQAAGLALLSERLRPAGLSVICYTGYTLEGLEAQGDPWVARLLRLTDILIDGPYVQAQAANLRWRGSRNQRVLLLTERYQGLTAEVEEGEAQVEFSVGGDRFTATGTWPGGLLERLEERLRE